MLAEKPVTRPVPTLRDPSASQDDIRLTLDAGKAGELLGIQVLDHIILGTRPAYMSLREQGLYTPPSAT